jgi:hypothetical protein
VTNLGALLRKSDGSVTMTSAKMALVSSLLISFTNATDSSTPASDSVAGFALDQMQSCYYMGS